MRKRKSAVSAELMPLHTYLHRRVREMPELTNVKISQALGYDRPNVVAMMFTGSMKVPVNKVPALAKVLELDSVALLRRVMLANCPEIWETLEQVVGKSSLTTTNEVALIEEIRDLLGSDDVPLHADKIFMAEMTNLLLAAHDRYMRHVLATSRDGQAPRDSKAGRGNAAMLELFRRQALERAALLRAGRTEEGSVAK